MRELKIRIGGGKKYCGKCNFLYEDTCGGYANVISCRLFTTEDFGTTLMLNNDKRGYLRLDECLNAEEQE